MENKEIVVSSGSLQEKNGIWQVVFHVNGKYKWRSTGVRVPNTNPASRMYRDAYNSAVAKIPDMRDKLIAELQNPVTKTAKKTKVQYDITLMGLLKEWLEYEAHDEVREQTYRTYIGYANKHIYPYFNENHPDLKACDVTPWIMQSFVNYLRECGLKINSIRKYLVPLRNATAYGTDRQLLLVDPLVNYRFNPKRKNLSENKRKAYSRIACQALMSAIEKEPYHPVAVPVVLALHFGLRREEILGLKWKSVDMDNQVITIENTVTKVYGVVEEEKTKSAASMRQIPFDDKIKEFFEYVQKRQELNKARLGDEYTDTGYVHTKENGKPFYPDVITKQLRKFLVKHQLEPVSLHELRHTFCTVMIAAGKDAKTVQQLMGHSDPRMTMGLYAHKVDDKVLATRGTVGDYLNDVA